MFGNFRSASSRSTKVTVRPNAADRPNDIFVDLDEADRKLPNTLRSLSQYPNAALKIPSGENKVRLSTSVSTRRNTDFDTFVPCTQERIVRVSEFGRVCWHAPRHEPHSYCTEKTGRAPLRVDLIRHLRRIHKEQPSTLAEKALVPSARLADLNHRLISPLA